MFLTELSIKRPVIATVMSLVLVLFGVFTFNKIPLRELPDIDTAKINIRTDYDGASAKIIDKQITQKIEERIGGTPGVISIDSISEDGRSSITLEFDLNIEKLTLRSKALEWSMTRGARSGRVAWQFILQLAGELNKKIYLN